MSIDEADPAPPAAPAVNPPSPATEAGLESAPEPRLDPVGDALAWVDEERLAASSASGSSTTAAYTRRDLLSDGPHRFRSRAGVIVPLTVLAAALGTYAVTTALWPLHNVAPAVSAVDFTPAAAPAAAVTWPTAGTAAIGIEGLSTVAANESQVPMASLTKVVTVLTALDALPLGVGEQGPTFSFDDVDSAEYWQYREENQSSLDVPVDGVLTEYQLLQGILMGSANNYADRLSDEIWGSDRDFVAAGERWLSQRDLAGIELATPSGFAWDNIATARALVELGKIAVANPVIGEIVATQAVDLPGAGTVTNTNRLLGQPGYIGIKTGTIGEDEQELFNLLTAKEITVDGTTVRMFAAVVAQPDDASRYDGTAALYDEVEEALRNQAPTVAKGAVLGSVDTLWGEHVDVVAGDDARVVLWNGAAASGTTAFSLGDDWAEGAKAGTVTITGPLDSTDAELVLGSELHGPDFWWRLTHPLELFGLGAVTG